MRGFKIARVGVPLIAVLLLAAIPAGASAKPQLLQLTEEGQPAKAGAVSVGVLVLGESGKFCTDKTEGTLGENPAKKVLATYTANKSRSCATEWSETGMLESETWESNGKLKITASVEIAQPGPCVYKYTKFKATEFEPNETAAGGETSGKLNKTLSNPTKGACVKKLTKHFLVSAEDEEEEWFGTELVA